MGTLLISPWTLFQSQIYMKTFLNCHSPPLFNTNRKKYSKTRVNHTYRICFLCRLWNDSILTWLVLVHVNTNWLLMKEKIHILFKPLQIWFWFFVIQIVILLWIYLPDKIWLFIGRKNLIWPLFWLEMGIENIDLLIYL